MPSSFRRGDLSVALLVMLCLLVGIPPRVHALCCNQPGSATLTPSQMNANLVCPLAANPCVVQAQTLDGPATCPVRGCALDFGARSVVFDGNFAVTGGTLAVRAGTITVNKTISSTSADAVIDLGTSGGACGSGAGDIVVRGPIDLSGPIAGLIRVIAGCRIGLEASGPLTASSSAGPGGTIDLRAGTAITQGAPLRAVGSGSDGGAIALTAGDDVLTQRSIDVRSQGDGEGGTITLRAGDAGLAGAGPGGTLTVTADLIADGSSDSDGETGQDGGGITLEASGPVVVATTATIRANGGAPDGGGGALTLLTQDPPAGVLTALDGDVTLAGPIQLRGASNGDGGDLDGLVGRTFALQGALDLSAGGDDAVAGNLILSSGADMRFESVLAANGRVATSTGGFVQAKAGFASLGTLIATKTIDVSAGAGSDSGEAILAGCRVTMPSTALVDARSSLPSTRPAIALAASTALTLSAGSRFLAPPGSGTLLAVTAATSVATNGATFNPAPIVTVVPAGTVPLPPCPVCGDGIRQPGEPCDPGAGADGACCSNDCLHVVCPTPTPSPTPTTLPTGPTATPTLSPTRTATNTPSPTVTTTPELPPIQPRPVLACERALAKGSSRVSASEIVFLEGCAGEVLTCLTLAGDDREACLARASRRCQSRFTKLVRARRTFSTTFNKTCAGDPPILPFALVRAPEVLAFATLDDECADEVGLALTSPSAVLACVDHGACAAERAADVAVPHLAELLTRVFDPNDAGLCLDAAAPTDLRPSRQAVRCQRAIAAAARTLFVRQLRVAQRCLDSLLACRLGGEACGPVADRCAKKLAALASPTDGPRPKVAASIARACGTIDPTAIFGATGLGFESVGARCLALGAAAPTTVAELSPCLTAAYGCAAGATVRRALPGIDGELARVGLALGDQFSCPSLTVSPTPTVTPGALATATPTPTASATPTTVPTANPVAVLVPGGGTGSTDCVAEWTVSLPLPDPPPITTVTCVDGDPSCDQDGIRNDICVIALGVCLTGTDPNLPSCPAAPGLLSYILQSPQPGAANGRDASNAIALLTVLSDLLQQFPSGSGTNTFTFSPPRVLTPPNLCTAPALVSIERRGLDRRTERFRARAIAADAGGGTGADDTDTLYLTCASQ